MSKGYQQNAFEIATQALQITATPCFLASQALQKRFEDFFCLARPHSKKSTQAIMICHMSSSVRLRVPGLGRLTDRSSPDGTQMFAGFVPESRGAHRARKSRRIRPRICAGLVPDFFHEARIFFVCVFSSEIVGIFSTTNPRANPNGPAHLGPEPAKA